MERRRSPGSRDHVRQSGPSSAHIDSVKRPAERQGTPLTGEVRGVMESRFGHDFGQVRVHHDADADHRAAQVRARAFAVGDDLYFRDGAFAPTSLEGAHLLAHELTHVVQRSHGEGDTTRISDRHDAAEAEARGAADAVLLGGSVSVTSPAGAAIAREDDGDSWYDTLGSVLELPSAIADIDVPGFDALGGITSAMVGVHDMMTADSTEGQVAGGLDTGSGILDLVGWMGEETLGAAGDVVGGIGGMFSAGSDALGAYEAFSEGDYGEGILNSVKGVGDVLGGLAEFGGFELATVAEMGAGEALAGAGAEGLAALGPVGAVIGAGVAGYEGGRMLDQGADWIGDMISGDEGADHSLSGMGADVMVEADQALTSLWADPNEPEYTQTIGWQLAEMLPSWMQ